MKEININFKEIVDYIKDKDFEIESWRYKHIKEVKEKQKYKSRNEKAIEYIKENCIDDEFYTNLTNKEKHIIQVLDILQGSDKDE